MLVSLAIWGLSSVRPSTTIAGGARSLEGRVAVVVVFFCLAHFLLQLASARWRLCAFYSGHGVRFFIFYLNSDLCFLKKR